MPKKRTALGAHAELSVKLSTRGAARLLARHPWVYRSDIEGIEANDVPPGSVVRVFDPRGKFLGTALYSSSSQIAIRMISHGSIADLPALVAERIRAAIAYRKELVANTNAYRTVFSEGDFLPGLIVDRY
ncbi:MAG: SAM-dependent methyltransferase, partial [Terriglobales bacterium]